MCSAIPTIPAAMKELLASSKKMEELLNPQEWARREAKALGDRLMTRSPAPAPVYKRFNRLSEGSKACPLGPEAHFAMTRQRR